MPSSTPSARQATIRRATTADAVEVAELFWRVRSQSVPHIPMIVHDFEKVASFVREVLLCEFEVWLAEVDGAAVGFLALMPPDQLGHLYIDADHTGQGLGARLLEIARGRFPRGLQLWTFQSNVRAIRFYERHRFVPVEWTDGNNEEGAPDVRLVWRPGQTEQPRA